MQLLEASLADSVLSALEPYTKAGWDSEDASPLSGAAILRLATFLKLLPQETSEPAVTPIEDGSVALYWSDNGIYLDTHVTQSGAVAVKYKLPDGSAEKRLFEPDGGAENIAEFLRPALSYIVRSSGMSSRQFSAENVTIIINNFAPALTPAEAA